jgi:hypothetical protein
MDRYQRAEIKNINFSRQIASKWGRNHGVPQVSIKGPVLFRLYTNYLPNFVKNSSEPIMFAGDTCITANKFFKRQKTVLEYSNKWFRLN